MTPLYWVLGLPLLGGVVLGLVGHWKGSGRLNIAFSAAGFAASAWLAVTALSKQYSMALDSQFIIDSFNVYLLALTAFVGFTTSIFSRPYMNHEAVKRNLTRQRLRLYHASFQSFLFTMQLALSTNNLGVLWVSLEGATLATVLLVSLYRTPESIEAAWKYFILCGVGIAQALFGTVLLYFAAAQVLPQGSDALLWTNLLAHGRALDPTILSLVFVFVFVGYGTKVGIVPLHNWLPDAHSEGPTPMSAVLSGLLLHVALYAIVRIKMITDLSLDPDGIDDGPGFTGKLMMAFGLLSFTTAALFLQHRRDVKRLFSYSSIEHMGLMTFGFGLGGPLATFGALLHMLVHGLTKSAIFITVGHAAQIAGTQQVARIRGLIATQPMVGWGLMFGVVAIVGFPPFGVFTSEFVILSATIHSYPWLAIPLMSGLALALGGLFQHVQPMVFGAAPKGQQPVPATMWPVVLHLLAVLWLGLAIPESLSQWLNQAVLLITGKGVL